MSRKPSAEENGKLRPSLAIKIPKQKFPKLSWFTERSFSRDINNWTSCLKTKSSRVQLINWNLVIQRREIFPSAVLWKLNDYLATDDSTRERKLRRGHARGERNNALMHVNVARRVIPRQIHCKCIFNKAIRIKIYSQKGRLRRPKAR